METDKMIHELRRLEEKHKDDRVFTGENNWSLMCHDVANKLQELQTANIKQKIITINKNNKGDYKNENNKHNNRKQYNNSSC